MSFDPKRGSITAYQAKIAQRKHENASKTHCPAGHPYDEANTIIRASGRRRCRECDRLYHERRHEKARAIKRAIAASAEPPKSMGPLGFEPRTVGL